MCTIIWIETHPNASSPLLSGRSVRSLWTSCPRTALHWAEVDPPPAWSPASRGASPTSACSPTALALRPFAPRSPPSRATWWRRSKCWTKEREEGRATTTRRWSTANRRRTDRRVEGWLDERRTGRERGGKTDPRPSASSPSPSGEKLRLLPPRNPCSPSRRGHGVCDDICTVMCVHNHLTPNDAWTFSSRFVSRSADFSSGWVPAYGSMILLTLSPFFR